MYNVAVVVRLFHQEEAVNKRNTHADGTPPQSPFPALACIDKGRKDGSEFSRRRQTQTIHGKIQWPFVSKPDIRHTDLAETFNGCSEEPLQDLVGQVGPISRAQWPMMIIDPDMEIK
jgi:hypothetical protein